MGDKALPSGSGFIDPNFPNPNGPDDASIIIYGYTPNLPLCILATVLFALALLTHLAQLIRYRYWSFLPVVLACAMEITGYAFRMLSSRKDPYRVTFFVVQYFMIVVAPVLLSASLYVCLTRVIAWAGSGAGGAAGGAGSSDEQGPKTGPKGGLLRNRRALIWGFISLDAVCTIVQVTGAALIGAKTSDGKDPKVPNDILLAGLAVQSAGFLVFLILLMVVILQVAANQGVMEKLHGARHPFLAVLSVASLLVFLRTLFRLAETSQGVFGYLSSHEGYFAGLEFVPVVLAVGLLGVWHPGRWPTARMT